MPPHTRRVVLAGMLPALAAGLGAAGPPATAAADRPRWLSGAGDPQAAHVAGGDFGRWRGDHTSFARIWADESLPTMAGVWMLDGYRAAGWTGTLDIACGGPRDGQTWSSAAAGGMDATWRATCRSVRAHWGNLRAVHLSMAHELNGSWYPWAVTRKNVTSFRNAWRRWYGIVATELVAEGKNALVCLSLNADTLSDVSVAELWPGPAYVDVLGCDFYSAWPDLTTEAEWDSHRHDTTADGSPRGIEAWFGYARSIGKPLSFPEWGLNPNLVSDNPLFVQKMRNTFAAHAGSDPHRPGPGQVAGEAYFNDRAQGRLWPSTLAPRAAARYQSLRWGI
ncbi:MAG: glycosyl hydrolase [Propionibacteriaceae bacterium]